MRNKVVVTGMGIISSVGHTPEECHLTLLKGKGMTRLDSRLQGLKVSWSCPVQNFAPAQHMSKSLIWRTDPFIQYALYAACNAVEDAGLKKGYGGLKTGIVLGNSLAGISSLETLNKRAFQEGTATIGSLYLLSTMGSMATGNIAIELGIHGPTYLTGTACSSGADAIGTASRLIESGECDIVIAGGSEAPITPLVVSSFTKLGALSKNTDLPHASRPFDKERDGFVISEGAAMMVLENEKTAMERGARIYATLSGYGSANDAHHITSPAPDGSGLSKAIYRALEDASLSSCDIQCINAHGTSTPLNDYLEGNTLSAIFPDHPWVTSTKGVTGHSLAATGAMEAIFSVLNIIHDEITPVAGLKNIDEAIKINIVTEVIKGAGIKNVLSTSLGFGGQNSALIFSKYNKRL
ncbi:beta-ketoacyl-[acyl-carrier-protein] synthase family protein [Escherichia coli]|uniref:beta-ketoacyl-[acyl-carrier-protein] synthase family protein n=1 Tax=Enterobacteriaceae TaxID=543 RepID=UPI0005304650|nr:MULTISPECIES: beta-ketoacyl-[acyl-carrier-protein] synthase family protein [Enterobacteriaceae]EEZ5661436.1 beta-ketoacyl-[acyl-carrier-protein] synthase family protein [Escherichia coli O5]EFN6663749.1 beta-ketoacyl-[acyl-carrier-protein] synthase family protein [Escherichia coli O7:H7]EIX9714124.1 beta-ketoacyl-[acyl-carrier-protein] synthase family protein [Klebsiella pneumoniae]EES4896655.1 beta-ketoacyl-[acyl-carrier-protein] synthase family protein [Escherichia coli]EEV6941727.1 beta-